jgi:hypothetical protein
LKSIVAESEIQEKAFECQLCDSAQNIGALEEHRKTKQLGMKLPYNV